ncbi:MAG: AAA family ATPase, partial [Thermoplasmata archaeon]|nr:AAA family ATPase [Thermoplasmata archaeon]
MYLKELHIENFKSFGRKVKIPFYPGFTGITGPNGSGKSNISDAILFVLGPKSSKVLRAGKLSELIFNGGKTGRPAKECKVTLVFDNTDRMIPVDSDEVRLTRVVRRSNSASSDANSYFYINGRKASLSEFDVLLAKARISADGYNFVQQGDINRIAKMGGVERRRILDDISGISRFDEDIAKAEKKKKAAEDNLDRLSILMDEIAGRVKDLEGERVEAVKYMELKERERRGEAKMAYKRMKALEKEMEALQENLAGFEEEKRRMEEERERLAGEIEELKVKIDELDREMASRGGDEAKELRERLDTLRVEKARASDRMDDAKVERRELISRKKELEREKKELSKEIEKMQEETASLERERTEVAGRLEKIREEIASLEKAASEADGRVEALKKEEETLLTSLEDVAEEKKAAALEIERYRIEEEGKRRELESLEEKEKELEAELKDVEWEMGELKKEKKSRGDPKKLRELFYAKKQEESRLSSESTELEERVKRLEREYERAKAKSEMAKNASLGYTPAEMAILEARDRGIIKGIRGTVAELINVRDDSVKTALSVAAGNRLNAIVVEDDGVAEEAIKHLKKTKSGRATFLPLNKMLPGRPRGKAVLASRDEEALGFARDLIEYDEEIAAAVWYVFGDTVVVRNLKTARRLMGGVRLVTLDGELVEASGAMIGGGVGKVSSFSVSKGELERLGEELRAARAAADTTMEMLRKVREELREIEGQLREAGDADGQISARMEALKARKKALSSELAGVRKNIEVLKKAIEDAVRSREDAERGLAGVEAREGKLKKMLSSLREKIAAATPRELGERLASLRGSEREEQGEYERLSREMEKRAPSLAVAVRRMEELDGLLEDIARRIDETKEIERSSARTLEKLEVEFRAVTDMLSKMDAEMEALNTEKERLMKKMGDLEREREKITVKLENREDFNLSLTSKLAGLREQYEALRSEFEGYGIEVEEPLPSFDRLKKEVEEAKRELESLGAVNLKAVEEYERQKERYDRLA